jgi:parallel beta-helix repeat protein
MRTTPLLALAALTLPTLACGSSSSGASPDAGHPADAAKTTQKADAGGDASSKGDAKSGSEAGGGSDAHLVGDGSPCDTPCAGVKGTCVPFVAGESETDIDTAFEMAAAGTTLAFGCGTFPFTNTIALLGTPNLTIKGAGIDKTILDFTGQKAGADGLDAQSSDHLTLFGFTVQNTKQNAIKVLSSSDVVFEAVKTAWTTAMGTSNGPYGIYPVSVQGLLIENCVVTGASDSGIYVGQSQNAVVRGNDVYGNVAGIEIENTWGAVVSKNHSHDNTAGILVFDLPNLPQQGGHDVRVVDNQVTTNNGANFAMTGDIVSKVPPGTGILVMANHDVEVTGNAVAGSNTFGIAVVSYYSTLIPITDTGYYPYPYNVWVHDNTLSGTGTKVDDTTAIGLLLTSAVSTFPGGHGPDLAYDGAIDPKMAAALADAGADGGANADPMHICFSNNGASSTFVDINIQKLVIYGEGDAAAPPGDAGPTNLNLIDSFSIAPFTCTRAATVAVDAGVTFSDASL